MPTERTDAITLKGAPRTLLGDAVAVGQKAPDFNLRAVDFSPRSLADFAGKVKVLVVVPSVDTPVCDAEVRRFNQEAVSLGEDVIVLTISIDAPPALKRWCGAAGIERVQTLSDFYDHSFGQAYGLRIKDLGLLARQVMVVDRNDTITYLELVPEVAQEPNYEAALTAAKAAR